jgi:hypothetical protein
MVVEEAAFLNKNLIHSIVFYVVFPTPALFATSKIVTFSISPPLQI